MLGCWADSHLVLRFLGPIASPSACWGFSFCFSFFFNFCCRTTAWQGFEAMISSAVLQVLLRVERNSAYWKLLSAQQVGGDDRLAAKVVTCCGNAPPPYIAEQLNKYIV